MIGLYPTNPFPSPFYKIPTIIKIDLHEFHKDGVKRNIKELPLENNGKNGRENGRLVKLVRVHINIDGKIK